MTRPTSCAECGAFFLTSPLLQAQVRHELALFGESAAEALTSDLLESHHEAHTGPDLNQYDPRDDNSPGVW